MLRNPGGSHAFFLLPKRVHFSLPGAELKNLKILWNSPAKCLHISRPRLSWVHKAPGRKSGEGYLDWEWWFQHFQLSEVLKWWTAARVDVNSLKNRRDTCVRQSKKRYICSHSQTLFASDGYFFAERNSGYSVSTSHVRVSVQRLLTNMFTSSCASSYLDTHFPKGLKEFGSESLANFRGIGASISWIPYKSQSVQQAITPAQSKGTTMCKAGSKTISAKSLLKMILTKEIVRFHSPPKHKGFNTFWKTLPQELGLVINHPINKQIELPHFSTFNLWNIFWQHYVHSQQRNMNVSGWYSEGVCEFWCRLRLSSIRRHSLNSFHLAGSLVQFHLKLGFVKGQSLKMLDSHRWDPFRNYRASLKPFTSAGSMVFMAFPRCHLFRSPSFSNVI